MGMVMSKLYRSVNSLAIKANDTNSLLCLPKVLFSSIFTKWIHLSDLCKFDSALCNTQNRSVFSLRVYFNNIILSNSFSLEGKGLSLECIDWLDKHKISVQFLYVNVESTVPDLFTFQVRCNKMFSIVKGLKVSGSSVLLHRIIDSVAQSLILTSFHFKHCCVESTTLSDCRLPINLTSLHFTNCSILCDAVLITLQAKCARLTDFQLTSCHNISDLCLDTVLQHVGAQLTMLTLNSCKKLTVLSFKCVVNLCPALKVLVFFSNRNITVNAAQLAEKCTSLATLTLYNVVFSGDIVVTKHQFAHLSAVSVDLFRGSSGNSVTLGGYVELTHFVRACPALKKLELLSRVMADQKTCLLSCLQHKQLDGMTALLRSLSVKLQSLSLSQCAHLTDSHIAALALQCPMLRQLVLLSCRQLTDQGLMMLAKQSRRLVFLSLSHCGDDVTTSGVSVSLKSLVCLECNKVSMNEVVKGNKKGVKLRY